MFSICATYGLLEVLPALINYKISRSEMTPLHIQYISSDTEDSDGFGMFAVCRDNIVRKAYKQDFKGQWKKKKTTEEME